ncbi:hypothetical protein LAZ67_9002713 [Cordylochernes scorpioides]|uniref:Transposase n=1 Tax=Cordylochernes scorpioides TaxID=51811 RepID=A0ABY6KXD0_9ARAC|nr:hypothetical protein LAZ67_9002713 [Cordylochernes scorpioides]
MTTHGHIRVQLYLAKHGIALLPQPPCSPELAPNDFFLYPKVKKVLKGRRFDSIPEIKENTRNILKSLKDEDFQRCFDIWKKRWNKCVDSDDGARHQQLQTKTETSMRRFNAPNSLALRAQHSRSAFFKIRPSKMEKSELRTIRDDFNIEIGKNEGIQMKQNPHPLHWGSWCYRAKAVPLSAHGSTKRPSTYISMEDVVPQIRAHHIESVDARKWKEIPHLAK